MEPLTRRSAAFCARLGIEVPIVQAPIAGIATPRLTAAVSNAGGLGMIALGSLPPDAVREQVRATRELTDRPHGANIILARSTPESVDAALDSGVKLLSLLGRSGAIRRPRPCRRRHGYVDGRKCS